MGLRANPSTIDTMRDILASSSHPHAAWALTMIDNAWGVPQGAQPASLDTDIECVEAVMDAVGFFIADDAYEIMQHQDGDFSAPQVEITSQFGYEIDDQAHMGLDLWIKRGHDAPFIVEGAPYELGDAYGQHMRRILKDDPSNGA